MAPQNVVVCLDNSKWSINGDFSPTRYIDQLEAAKAIITQITSSNPESKAALINLASKRLVRSFSSNTEYLVEKLKVLDCEGDVDLIQSLQIANLVLNNSTDERVIKRIVLFVGSNFQLKPYDATYLKCLFRENNINVSIVQFGEEPSKLTYLLEEMIAPHKCNKPNLNHHYIFAKSNESSLKHAVNNAPICKDPQSASSGGDHHVYNESMMDDDMDEELQLALKLSRDEYNQKLATTNNNDSNAPPGDSNNNPGVAPQANDDLDIVHDKDMEIMQKAKEIGVDPSLLQDLDEEEREQLLMAIALSLEQAYSDNNEKKDESKNNEDPK